MLPYAEVPRSLLEQGANAVPALNPTLLDPGARRKWAYKPT